MNIKKLYLALGIFLVVDGILSLYWGNFELNHFIESFGTMNNSVLGNLIRIVRVAAGGVLIYYNHK